MLQPPSFADFLGAQWYHNSLKEWLVASATAAIVLLVFLLVRRVLVSRIGALAFKTATRIDDMVVDVVKETRTWVLAALAIYIASESLTLPKLDAYLPPVAKLVLLWQAALWGGSIVAFWVKQQLERRTGTHDRASIAMINAMGVGAKGILWILILITALKSVFNIEITPLITGLGVSGIAIALAVQNILGDLLAALAIVFDKPFDVGDRIGVDSIAGTVEHIGLKTTRIRSITGEQIVIGNGDLLKSRLRNFERMSRRRVLFTLDLSYTTPIDTLGRLPKIVQEIVEAQTPVKFDRSHVASFGESAIRLETVYHVLDPDYGVFMNIQQAINLEILRRFAAEKAQFAFPAKSIVQDGAVVTEISTGSKPQTA